MDDILIAYWDAMEEYYTSHKQDMYGMSKADFISFVIYMYSNWLLRLENDGTERCRPTPHD